MWDPTVFLWSGALLCVHITDVYSAGSGAASRFGHLGYVTLVVILFVLSITFISTSLLIGTIVLS